MEDASVTENGHGKGNVKQPDTAQQQHVFTTKVFIEMGEKDVENDEPFLIDATSIVQKDVVNGKEIGEESVNKSWKLISEDEVVVVSKTSTAFHSELLPEQEGPGGETKETDGSTVESLLLNIETVIDDGLLNGTHEPENDKTEVLDEDAPVVIEKSPVSPNMEIAIEGEDPSDVDLKNARENDEIGEEVTEDEVAVVEKTPVASSLESDILVENPDDGGKEDDTTTVDSLLANIESVIDQSPLERPQEPANKNTAEVIEELAPVVEKKSFSLDVEHLMKETDEGSEDGEHVTKQRQSFVEDEVIMVKKTVVVCKVESEILVENPDDEGKHADNTTVQSLLNNIESVIDDELPERPQELEDTKKSDALEEDYPIVVKKKPISVNVKQAIDFDVKEDEQDIDPVVETEVVVVEKETRAILESELLVDNEEAKKGDSATVEDLLVTVEKVIDVEPSKRTHESLQEKGKPLAEDSPIVIDKRPPPFDMDQMMEQDEETKEQEKKDPVCETAPIVVEKTAVTVESEMLVDNEEIEDDDSTPVETLLVNIESVVDRTLLETAKEPSENVVEALEEDSPVVIEKRPASFYIEHPLDEDHEKKDVDEREPVSEAELVVVEKTPVALESDMLVDNEQSEEDDSTPVEILLVNIESVVDHTLLKVAKEPSEDVVEALEEDSPVVIEKRPASVCIEHPLDENHEMKDEDEREPVSEIEVVVVEKTPVALESDMLVDNEESKEEDSTPVETLLVNIESVVDHTLLKDAKEPSEDVVEALEEDSPVVIEKRPASLHIEHPLDEDLEKKDVDEREPVSEAEFVVVEKTPVALESDMLVENEETKEDDSTPLETLLVNIESVVDHTLLEAVKIPSEDVAEVIEEDSAVVIEKRPASFCIEHPLDEDLEKKDVDEREPVSEAEFVVVEKTPVALESDMLVDSEETKEKDSASVETLLENIKSVIDNTTPDQTEEPASAIKPDVLEEDAPIVIEKRPILLHMEEMLDEMNGEGDPEAPVTESELVVVNKTPVIVESGILVEKEGTEGVEDDNATIESLLVNVESVIDHQLPKEGRERADEMKTRALQEDEPVVIERSPVSLHVNQLDEEDNQKENDNSETVEGEHELPKSRELVSEAKLVVINKTPASLESEILIELESPENDHSTVESLLVNIESVIDDTSPEQPKVEDDTQPSESKEPIEETVPRAVEKRKRDSSEMEELFVAQNPEESTEKEGRSQDESSNLVDEVVINVVEKKRVCHEQPSETLENQSSVSAESTSVIVLDIPLVEKTEVVKDSVQETVPPAMERKAAESEEELLQRTDEDEPTEPECRETAILDDLEGETLKSTSYTKLFDKDEGSDDEFLRQVLSRKRLSAPEILPEKEKDGSAPLAPSESGILDSKEHVPTAHLSHTREAIPMSTLAKADNSSSNVGGAHDEEKLIPGVPREAEKVKDAEGQAAKGLLEADDEDQIDGKRNRLGKKGLASPQCKCCSLM